jgi:hypothetical protein
MLLAARALSAQDDQAAHQHEHHLEAGGQQHDHDVGASDGSWIWSSSASAFFGFNDQERKFRDFSTWESQNWFMVGGERRAATGSVRADAMFSLEPFTLQKLGSPQVFQTGETYQRAPLIDYQHPHDLIMGLGVEGRRLVHGLTLVAEADVVGSPSLGPTAFMHRASAEANPQAPLSHHDLDSTHITPGVLRAGVGRGGLMFDASIFHGREPDEDRTDIDLGRLDSYAARLSWTGGNWHAQASGAYLTQPELITPYDAKRLTASIEYVNPNPGRLKAMTAAFGQNREIHGNFEAYLVEAEIAAWRRDVVYTRVESVAKDILDAGFHPRGVFHRHRQSQVGALTLGYLHTIADTRGGRIGAGADITGYSVPANLDEPYGSPLSFHAFVKYSFELPRGHAHVR